VLWLGTHAFGSLLVGAVTREDVGNWHLEAWAVSREAVPEGSLTVRTQV
jgi:hypothetical protein